MVSYDKAIELRPDYAEAHWNLSILLLLLGDLRNGWQKYEYGRLTKNIKRRVVLAPYPLWNGEPLADKGILITAEQGVGDEVMFASCIPDLINLNPKKIILECDLRLAPLFARSFPQLDIQGKDRKDVDWLKELEDIDFQVAIGSLPVFFRPKLDSFPYRRSFLKPAPELFAKWRSRYAGIGKELKIGLSWRGGKDKNVKRIRSIDLPFWEPIFRSGAHFVNLQYGDHSEEINQIELEMGIHIYDWEDADPLVDLDSFAAQIAALDLVISVDNSTVHIAGAVGTPVWGLIPYNPDWRWMLKRSNSLWYSTVHLFRQQKIGDWNEVIDTISTKLQMMVRQSSE